VIAAVLSLLFDLNHCARWHIWPSGRVVCGDVKLDAACPWDGWHVVYQGVAVCVRACEGGKPVT
jgi:hypothetical protein